MRRNAALALLLLACTLYAATPVWADLSAKSAFTLIRRVAPGDDIREASAFLGDYASERAAHDMKVRRWGTIDDEWFFDVLHDASQVRATRITWVTKGRRDQQTTYAQLTAEGKRFFGAVGTFNGFEEAEWREMGGKLLVRVRMGKNLEEGVTLLTGIRNDPMSSEKYGF